MEPAFDCQGGRIHCRVARSGKDHHGPRFGIDMGKSRRARSAAAAADFHGQLHASERPCTAMTIDDGSHLARRQAPCALEARCEKTGLSLPPCDRLTVEKI